MEGLFSICWGAEAFPFLCSYDDGTAWVCPGETHRPEKVVHGARGREKKTLLPRERKRMMLLAAHSPVPSLFSVSLYSQTGSTITSSPPRGSRTARISTCSQRGSSPRCVRGGGSEQRSTNRALRNPQPDNRETPDSKRKRNCSLDKRGPGG